MGAHTPGPWVAPPSQSFYVKAAGEVICNANTQANARLIAAAPDLLETCRSTLAALENMTTEAFANGGDKAVREALSAIIAKAGVQS